MRIVRRPFVVLTVLVALAVVGVYGWVHLAPVGPRDLMYSVAGGSGGNLQIGSSCRRTKGEYWRCLIDDTEGSGNASTYRVRMKGRRCWTARWTPSSYANRQLRSRVSGCVGFWDRVRLWDR